MIRVRQIKISVLEDNEKNLRKKILQTLKIRNKDFVSFHIRRKSIDARDKKNVLYVYEVDVEVVDEKSVLEKVSCTDIFHCEEEKYVFPKLEKKKDVRPIVVGSGPAGLFCAYMLAEAGLKPLVFERGERIEDRIRTVDEFFETGVLNPESNIQFGEGGAGTFSDGKLNTLTKDKEGRIRKVLEVFVENGAPEEILYVHNPHIGTDLLRKVIVKMRRKILRKGGKFYYKSCVTDLVSKKGKITGVEINHDKVYPSSIVVFAIGHSARDTFMMLHEKEILMKPKNFAVGVRVEHLRSMIDAWQYGEFADEVGSASYKLTYQTKDGRGVYSFCMCPGGYVVNASSEEGRLVVNGMSNYDRSEVNSNSAIVVSVTPKDFGNELFSGMEFQRKLEEAAYQVGGGLIPVQRYEDFCMHQVSDHYGAIVPHTKGDVTFGDLRDVLPEFVSSSIMEAMPEFGSKIEGFDQDDTLLLGVETRTSSPVVIVRGDDMVSTSLQGLYPCGEGAGYAGGITTAAIDGIKVAEKIVLSL